MKQAFVWLVMAYLLGSIPSGVWVGKLFYQKDIRQHGSGNMGATNTFRVLGPKAGTIVLVLDALKGWLPVFLYLNHFANQTMPLHPLIVGLMAIMGHTFPLFAAFKGGKSVATLAGVMVAYQPLLLSLALGVFLIVLFLSRMVSLSSMVAITSGVLLSLFWKDWILSLILLAIDCFIIYRHRTNIQRIKSGTESKVTFPWEKKDQD